MVYACITGGNPSLMQPFLDSKRSSEPQRRHYFGRIGYSFYTDIVFLDPKSWCVPRFGSVVPVVNVRLADAHKGVAGL